MLSASRGFKENFTFTGKACGTDTAENMTCALSFADLSNASHFSAEQASRLRMRISPAGMNTIERQRHAFPVTSAGQRQDGEDDGFLHAARFLFGQLENWLFRGAGFLLSETNLVKMGWTEPLRRRFNSAINAGASWGRSSNT